MRIALGIEYDGAGFNGLADPARRARSPGLRSNAPSPRSRAVPVSTICAGRTDAGVHALDQVVHFDTDVERPLTAWVRGTNRSLPPTVAGALGTPVVPEDFHARYRRAASALRLLDPERSGALAAGPRARGLDLPTARRRRRCSAPRQLLVGTHDFTSFRVGRVPGGIAGARAARTGGATIRRAWLRVCVDGQRVPASHGAEHRRRRWCYVGLGRQPPEWIADVLAARDRTRAAPTLGPDGLYLARVEYDARFDLPSPGTVRRRPGSNAHADQDLRPDS